MTRIASIFFSVALLCPSASAQEIGNTPSRPIVGGTINPSTTTSPTFGASSDSEILRHRDFTGKRCLEVIGSARPHTINPNLYDHVITARNKCPQRIAIRVCYYGTSGCIPIEIPGGERKEAILGTLPAGKDFRFEFREKRF